MCAHLWYASTMARFIPYTCLLAIPVYCVWYGVMYGDMRYGDMHGGGVVVACVCYSCTSVRCPSRVRGMTCNILVRLPF